MIKSFLAKSLANPMWTGIGVVSATLLSLWAILSSTNNLENKNLPQNAIDQNWKIERSEELQKEVTYVLRNLDKTKFHSVGFDYWPSGGLRSAYYHIQSLVSYRDLTKISPVPVFISGPHSEDHLDFGSRNEFGHYNPEFIDWIEPHVHQLLVNHVLIEQTKPNIDKYLGHILKTYWIVYQELERFPEEKQKLLTRYSELIKAQSLPSRYYYYSDLSEYSFYHGLHEEFGYNTFEPALFFWLRRELDGTSKRLFSLIDAIHKTYYPSDNWNGDLEY